MISKLLSVVYNKKENSVRGSFVNLLVTFIILVLICVGAFDKNVASNLKNMETLIIGFFGISFSVWTYGKVKSQQSQVDPNQK